MTILAIALAACAAVLALPGGQRLDGDAHGHGRLAERSSRALLAVPALAGASLVAFVDGLHLLLALIVLVAATAAAGLFARGRRRKDADARQAKVVEVCEALVGELRSGQPLVTALEHCRELWPEFEPAVAAGRLGADVPASMRELAALPGAAGLGEVAAAWQISEGSGAGLSFALGQVAASAREAQATRALVSSELASAQATARLVALLPVAALMMSAGLGGDPWQFLLGTPVGLACLGTGLASAYVGLVWIDHIAAGVLER